MATVEQQQPKDLDLDEDAIEERKHVQRIVNAFMFYKIYADRKLERARQNFRRLSTAHQNLLPHHHAHTEQCAAAVNTNYAFITAIIGAATRVFENSDVANVKRQDVVDFLYEATAFDMDKVVTTVKQFFRDWSREGADERSKCYGPIIEELKREFPETRVDISKVSVLVPGSGLGRLAYEIAHHGYQCQGNEFSMFMLLASHFILNICKGINAHTIHPWVLQTCNNWSNEHQLAAVQVPDVNPSNLPHYGLFSMAAGDFLEVYTEPDQWDGVVCCFFIDTAHNIISYLERIYTILKPGGLWINLGPLLYHFADMPGESSLEINWSTIVTLITQIGFVIEKEDHTHSCPYIQNPHSMLQMHYQCVLLVARKPTNRTQATAS